MKQELNIVNKKAEYEFFLVEKYVAGMMLTGTEIKSVRQGKVNMSD
ncbi:MAG: SsrA-binding protein, partial [Bacteroidetes bacterium]|nr:SsrA-binding protein [Bacteroidota bacterium]